MPSNTDITFSDSLPFVPDGGVVHYAAAAPPDYRSSFEGSALPFADAQQAFYNTPNRGTAHVDADGRFTISMRMPNSYYLGLGTVRQPPMVHLVYTHNGARHQTSRQISRGVPYRSLTYPAKRANAMFYAPEALLVRSQEAILMASAYPDLNVEADDFWGGKPAR